MTCPQADEIACGVIQRPPASPGSAWTETALHTLPNDGSSGCDPNEGVVIGNNGVLYGVTQSGSYNHLNAQAPTGGVIGNNGFLYGSPQTGSYNPLNAQAPPEVSP